MSAPSSGLIERYLHLCQYLEALPGLASHRRPAYSPGAPSSPPALLRCQRVLDHLGHPERRLRFVHVTGTSGKGSVVHMLHRMFFAAGLRVGSHVSPHVVTPLERIAWGDGLLPMDVWVEGVELLQPFVEREYVEGPFGPPSYQELLFGLALWAFDRLGTDWVVLEVGIGGRLDATNVIPAPAVAIVTEVGLDHTELLGPDHASIARDKAGIFKPGSAALTGVQRPDSLAVIEDEASKLGIPLWRLGIEGQMAQHGQHLLCTWPGCRLEVQPGMAGTHQARNAALVVAAAQLLRTQGEAIEDAAILEGISRAFLPGRTEQIRLPGSGLLLLDIAHNVDKIEGLVEYWLEREGPGGAALLAISQGKDVDGILLALARAFSCILLTQPLSTRRPMCPPLAVLERALALGIPARVVLDPGVALRMAYREGRGRVVVTGSTFLVAEVRRWFAGELDVLERGRIEPIDRERAKRLLEDPAGS